jgi:hypothetical protein
MCFVQLMAAGGGAPANRTSPVLAAGHVLCQLMAAGGGEPAQSFFVQSSFAPAVIQSLTSVSVAAGTAMPPGGIIMPQGGVPEILR